MYRHRKSASGKMFVHSAHFTDFFFPDNITFRCYKRTTLKDRHIKVSRSSRKVSIYGPDLTKNSTPNHVSWKSAEVLKSLHRSRCIGTREENEETSFMRVSFANVPRTTHLLAGFPERGTFKSILGSKKIQFRTYVEYDCPGIYFCEIHCCQLYYVENPCTFYCYKLTQHGKYK